MQFSVYTTLVCLLVFLFLGGLSVFAITLIVRMQTRLIRLGGEDVRLLTDDIAKKENKTLYAFGRVTERVLSLLLCVALLVLLVLSICSSYGVASFGSLPAFRVVKSSSMAEKHERNTYLTKNSLDDQFAAMDLILTQKPPAEFELELYDIVVYELEDSLIVHRIVGIEEPNDKHPGERLFYLQGDAVPTRDREPVRYSQIRAIYTGERYANIGSIISFFQEPAGWMCILAVILYTVATPIVQRRMDEEVAARLMILEKERVALYGTPIPKKEGEDEA